MRIGTSMHMKQWNKVWLRREYLWHQISIKVGQVWIQILQEQCFQRIKGINKSLIKVILLQVQSFRKTLEWLVEIQDRILVEDLQLSIQCKVLYSIINQIYLKIDLVRILNKTVTGLLELNLIKKTVQCYQTKAPNK